MALNLDAFRNIAKSAFITSRDIAIQGSGENATAKLGNYVFSAGKSANKAVMDAFRTALENEYGSLGTHAFDTVLGSRDQLRNLRTRKRSLSALPSAKT